MMGLVGQHDNRQMIGHGHMDRQEPNLVNLMREHQVVSENLSRLRDQLGREGVVGDGRCGKDVDSRGLNNVNNQLPRNHIQGESDLVNTKMQLVSKLAELEQRKIQMDRVLAAGRGPEAATYRPRFSGDESRNKEIEVLRARLRELEDMVSVLDRPLDNSVDGANMQDQRASGNGHFDFSHSFSQVEQNSFSSIDNNPDPGAHSLLGVGSVASGRGGIESDSQEALERSLALLTAQYEKTNHEDERLEMSPGMHAEKSGDKSEHEIMPPAMVPLNNSESVRLARELRDKRDQLEQLMQKNVFTTNVNELPSNKQQHDIFNNSTSNHGRSKDTNRSHGIPADGGGRFTGFSSHHPPDTLPTHPAQAFSDTWIPGQSNTTSQQLYRLQDQVTKLKGELDRLSLPQIPTQTQSRQEGATSNQIAQLSASVNQLYSGLWAMQRDVSTLTERLVVLERTAEGRPESRETIPSPNTVDENREQWRGNNNMNNIIWPGNTLAEPEWPSQQFPVWEGGGHHHFSPFPSRDLWNSLQASPGFSNPLHPVMGGIFGQNFHISETDSGVSSGALNNQVSPGLRANNYYDNFRSFSRQNRLSGPSGPSQGLPVNSRSVQQQRPAQQPVVETANNMPSVNASTRPRRKYKINREQNRDRGMIEQNNVRRRTEVGDIRGANPVLAANTYTSPTTTSSTTGVDSLTKNIYSQVGALIQQNDRAPELLAKLLQDLTLLGQQDRTMEDPATTFRSRNTAAANMNLDTADTSSFTSEEARDTRPDQSRASARASRSKVSGKRLTSGPQSVFPVLVANSAFDHEQSSSDNPIGSSVGLEVGTGSAGGDGWGQSAPVQPWNITPPQLEQASGVAVPKNQQKNLISRERDSRKMPGWRERLLPRNMQGGEDQNRFSRETAVSMPGHDRALPDQDGFVNIQLELPLETQQQQQQQEGQNISLHHSLADMAEAELAEADQVHDVAEGEDGGHFRVEEHFLSPTHDHSSYHPEGVFPVRDSDSPLRPVNHQNQSHAGLDRVPIRLPSSSNNHWPGPLPSPSQAELDRLERRLVEEDAVASIVEEVLASSPELANNQGADLPPTP